MLKTEICISKKNAVCLFAQGFILKYSTLFLEETNR